MGAEYRCARAPAARRSRPGPGRSGQPLAAGEPVRSIPDGAMPASSGDSRWTRTAVRHTAASYAGDLLVGCIEIMGAAKAALPAPTLATRVENAV